MAAIRQSAGARRVGRDRLLRRLAERLEALLAERGLLPRPGSTMEDPDVGPVGLLTAHPGGRTVRAAGEGVNRRWNDATAGRLSVGKVGFVERHRLWSDEQKEAAERIASQVEQQELSTVRVSRGDQHGVVRGKTLTTHNFSVALRNGQDFQRRRSTWTRQTTCSRPCSPGWRCRHDGAGRRARHHPCARPDHVPGAALGGQERAGCLPTCTSPPGSTSRHPLGAQAGAGAAGPVATRVVAGLEVEVHITKLEDPMLQPPQSGWLPDPPKVSAIAHGFQYLTEHRNDEIDSILQVLQENLLALGCRCARWRTRQPGSVRVHLRPGLPSPGLADNMLLFRTAAKQPGRRDRYHTRPRRRDQAGAAQLLLQWLAPAPVAAAQRRRQRLSPTAPTTASRSVSWAATTSAASWSGMLRGFGVQPTSTTIKLLAASTIPSSPDRVTWAPRTGRRSFV